MRRGLALALIMALPGSAAPVRGQVVNENLIAPMPAGFEPGARASGGGSQIAEFVPRGETVDSWSELITTQTFPGQRRRDTAAFLSQIGERWLLSCPGSRPDAIHTGQTNGYAVSMLILRCERSAKTGHAENTLFRAIAGEDGLYLVQYAFRSPLDRPSLSKALAFMSTVTVCDSRSPHHPCP